MKCHARLRAPATAELGPGGHLVEQLLGVVLPHRGQPGRPARPRTASGPKPLVTASSVDLGAPAGRGDAGAHRGGPRGHDLGRVDHGRSPAPSVVGRRARRRWPCGRPRPGPGARTSGRGGRPCTSRPSPRPAMPARRARDAERPGQVEGRRAGRRERPRTSSPSRAATWSRSVGAELVALRVDAGPDAGLDHAWRPGPAWPRRWPRPPRPRAPASRRGRRRSRPRRSRARPARSRRSGWPAPGRRSAVTSASASAPATCVGRGPR